MWSFLLNKDGLRIHKSPSTTFSDRAAYVSAPLQLTYYTAGCATDEPAILSRGDTRTFCRARWTKHGAWV